jgi:hypothetical protein
MDIDYIIGRVGVVFGSWLLMHFAYLIAGAACAIKRKDSTTSPTRNEKIFLYVVTVLVCGGIAYAATLIYNCKKDDGITHHYFNINTFIIVFLVFLVPSMLGMNNQLEEDKKMTKEQLLKRKWEMDAAANKNSDY